MDDDESLEGYGSGDFAEGDYAADFGQGVMQTESKAMGKSMQQMLDTDPKTWLIIADLPTFVKGSKQGTDVGGLGSFHTGGINTVFGDGSVHFISQNVDVAVRQQLGNRADKTLTQLSF